MMTTVLQAQFVSGASGAACSTDINRNGLVDGADLAVLLNGWGAHPLGHRADFNSDRMIDGVDLASLLNNWGACN
jgi:hypothetical protein